ncbi:K+ channel protein [Globisporangium polare]
MATPAVAPTHNMKYRFLGHSGLRVSQLSFGAMPTFKSDFDEVYGIITTAFEHGVNFFDNTEGYGGGSSETIMGRVIQRGVAAGVWTREDLVLTTKIFLGTKSGPNDQGISRKHIVEGTKASLKRLQLGYVDVIFCHRPEAATPIEETVRAMNHIIDQGWAFYWGTSEWTSHDIIEACDIADRLGLIRPIVEQPQYHIFERSRVDYDYVSLYKKYKLGLTTWSPLAFGILTGKYSQGIPDGSRLENAYIKSLVPEFEERVGKVEKLKVIAEELGCSVAQLAIAWCASNPSVSTVMFGASSVQQLEENLKASDIIEKITPEIKSRIDEIAQFVSVAVKNDKWSTIRSTSLHNTKTCEKSWVEACDGLLKCILHSGYE